MSASAYGQVLLCKKEKKNKIKEDKASAFHCEMQLETMKQSQRIKAERMSY